MIYKIINDIKFTYVSRTPQVDRKRMWIEDSVRNDMTNERMTDIVKFHIFYF